MNGLFQSRDGTSLYYEVHGKGRPLILCYGLLCRREHWKQQVAFFERKYQVVLVDYRGHQRSSLPKNERHLTVEWCARDVQDLVQHLGLEEAVCMGHSVGVAVLTHLALIEPRIRGNVFICGSVNNPFEQMLFTDRLDALFDLYARFYEALPHAGETLWRVFTAKHPLSRWMAAQLGFNPEAAEGEAIESYLEGVRQTPPEVFYRLMQDYRQVDRMPLLADISIPTLVIAGEDDCITPLSVQKSIVDLLPNAELETIAEGSHNAHLDFPERVNERIETFLRRIEYQ